MRKAVALVPRMGDMRKAVALVAVAATTAAMLGLAGASASPKSGHRQVLNMRLVATNGYFVDNNPGGQSGGDLFGSAGELRRHGHKIGRASSACTLVPPVGGQCQVTLIRRRGGHIQLAGSIRFPATTRNRIAIVGGTGKFRKARGDAIFDARNQQGSIQRLRLTVLH
jgi:hypothetical protein